mgnify:CR=1 FL=1
MSEDEFTVYVLQSGVDGRLYVGFTGDLERRIKEHSSGTTFSTKPYRPWKVVYTEHCIGRVYARKREKYWKAGSGKKKLKRMLSSK